MSCKVQKTLCDKCGYGIGYSPFENLGLLRGFVAKFHVVCKYSDTKGYMKAIRESRLQAMVEAAKKVKRDHQERLDIFFECALGTE